MRIAFTEAPSKNTMEINKATHVQLDLTSDLQKWRAFLAIAELGGLTRAALFLDSNQSLLSRHLNALERECKTRLFNRTGRGVALSDVGQRIPPHVKSPLAGAAQFELEIRGEAREPAGRVTIGSLPSITNPMVGRLFTQLIVRHPGIRLKILEESSGQVEEWLAFGALLRYGTTLPPRLTEIAILITGRACRSPFEWYAHRGEAEQAGVEQAVIEAILAGAVPTGLSPDDAAVYHYAVELNRHNSVSDATYAAALARFGERAVVELTALIGYYTMVAMTLNCHEIPLPEGAEPAFALPQRAELA